MTAVKERETNLPIRHNITMLYVFSGIIAVLMVVVSVSGLLYSTTIYPSDALLRSFVPNDVVNLSIGLLILLGSMWLTRRGEMIGLLSWPGALFYVLYNEIAYVFALPLTVVFLLHLALLTLSAYTTIILIASIDGKAVQQRFTGALPIRVAGGILVGFGLLFLLRVIGSVVNALIKQTTISAYRTRGLHSRFFGLSSMDPRWVVSLAAESVWVRYRFRAAFPGQYVVYRADYLPDFAAIFDQCTICSN